jgi:hypothetical protein
MSSIYDSEKLFDGLNGALGKSGWSSADISSLASSVSSSSNAEVDEIIETFLVGEDQAVEAIRMFMRGKKSAARMAAQGQQEKVLGMFKPGRPLKSNPGKGSNQKATVQLATPSFPSHGHMPTQSRQVINCLGCGLIYLLVPNEAGSQSIDTKRMLESGCCVFCNNVMSFDDSRSTAQFTNATQGSIASSNEAAKEAFEFKDRLLSYDKNSTKVRRSEFA